jgi:hypothetical protein
MDLFRAILLDVEAQPTGHPWSARPLLDYSLEDVVAHVRLIADAGLVEARFLGPIGNGAAMVLRMTNDGHDFLEASKQLTFWEKAKQRLKSGGLPVTVYAMKQVHLSQRAFGALSISLSQARILERLFRTHLMPHRRQLSALP